MGLGQAFYSLIHGAGIGVQGNLLPLRPFPPKTALQIQVGDSGGQGAVGTEQVFSPEVSRGGV